MTVSKTQKTQKKKQKKQRVCLDSGHLGQCDISTNHVECWRLHQDWSKGTKAAPNESPVSLDAHRVSLLDQGAADLIRSYHSKDFFLAFQKVASASDFVMVQCWICCGVTRGFVAGPWSRISWLVVAKWNPWSSRSSLWVIWGPSLSATRPPSDRLWSMISCHLWYRHKLRIIYFEKTSQAVPGFEDEREDMRSREQLWDIVRRSC